MHDHDQVIGMYPEVVFVAVAQRLQGAGSGGLRLLFSQLPVLLQGIKVLYDAHARLNQMLSFERTAIE